MPSEEPTDQNEAKTPEQTPAPDEAAPHTPGRPEQLGLPPDNDEEQHVLTVRPAIFKAYPFRATGLVIFPLLVTIALLIFTELKITQQGFYLTMLAIAAVCWIVWFVWWVRFRWTCSLYITNKRTIERRGLLSRSSDEVLHDHVRNVNIEQKFLERVFNVGAVGISSAGQSGTEIQVEKIPDPDRVKEIIDAYRDDLGRFGRGSTLD